MANQKNVAIIGGGMVAKTHLMALADLADTVEVTSVCTSNAASAQKFAEQARSILGYKVSTYADIDAIAADADVDFALILTPPNARLEAVQKLATSGKHILMEKPVERTSAAATEIVSMCETANVKLGIVFQHRVRKSSQQLVSSIKAGNFGALKVAEAHIPWWREQAYYDEPGRGSYARDGGGVLISQAIHTLDLMLTLTGDVAEVQAMAHRGLSHTMESEDYVTVGIRFENGAAGSIIASTASYPGGAESIRLHFEKASVHLEAGQLHINWRDGRQETIGETGSTGGGADPMAFTHEWHRGIIEDFVAALENEHPPIANGREALKVHHLIDAIMRSSDEKRSIELGSNGTKNR